MAVAHAVQVEGQQGHGTARATARQARRRHGVVTGLADVVVTCAVALAVLATGLGLAGTSGGGTTLAAVAVGWLVALAAAGAYGPRRLGRGGAGLRQGEYGRVLLAGLLVLVGTGLLAYVPHVPDGRTVVLTTLPVLVAGGLALRFTGSLVNSAATVRTGHRVVLVGPAGDVRDLARRLRADPASGVVVVGAVVPDGDVLPQGTGIPSAQGLHRVRRVVERFAADAVLAVPSPGLTGESLRRVAWSLEGSGADLVVAPGLVEVGPARVRVRAAGDVPLVLVEHPRLSGGRRVLKGTFDRVSAGLGVLLLSPVLVGLALAIKVGSPGPVLFRQQRVGVRGREFTVLKFRTMVVDAEERLAALNPDNESDGVLFKMRADPRVTPVGRVLRRYSVDELPQLLNVLRGDMSLVGPRPPLPSEVARYDDDVRRRLLVKPGLTGLWQVSGRSDLSWEDSVRLDLRYVDNWSLAFDLRILVRTARAVLTGAGAY